jgi:hypothetical protein
MNGKIRHLQVEIEANLKKIAEAYTELDDIRQQPTGKARDAAFGYYMHVLYGLFENMFVRIAEDFGNQIEDKSRWHSELLWRMSLDVMPLRPVVISQESYQCLKELRGFRHLFRNAYLLHFDPVRLNIVWQYADRLRGVYGADLNRFLDYLKLINE